MWIRITLQDNPKWSRWVYKHHSCPLFARNNARIFCFVKSCTCFYSWYDFWSNGLQSYLKGCLDHHLIHTFLLPATAEQYLSEMEQFCRQCHSAVKTGLFYHCLYSGKHLGPSWPSCLLHDPCHACDKEVGGICDVSDKIVVYYHGSCLLQDHLEGGAQLVALQNPDGSSPGPVMSLSLENIIQLAASSANSHTTSAVSGRQIKIIAGRIMWF